MGFFIGRVREYLHIVLCLSPVGEAFRKRVRMFPSLVNCCTINWFEPWPEDALKSVAMKFLSNIDALKDEDKLQASLSDACVFVHKSVEEEAMKFDETLKRKVYITPKSYLDLIKSYEEFLNEKRTELSGRRTILNTGLTKLTETNTEVAKL